MSIEENVIVAQTVRDVLQWADSDAARFTDDGKTRFWQRVMAHAMQHLPDELQPKTITQQPTVPMNHAEVCLFGMQRMEFGKYQGRMVDEVPMDYLLWLDGQPDFRRQLHRYLASPEIQRTMDDVCDEGGAE